NAEKVIRVKGRVELKTENAVVTHAHARQRAEGIVGVASEVREVDDRYLFEAQKGIAAREEAFLFDHRLAGFAVDDLDAENRALGNLFVLEGPFRHLDPQPRV